jgi:hypothetical protein
MDTLLTAWQLFVLGEDKEDSLVICDATKQVCKKKAVEARK